MIIFPAIDIKDNKCVRLLQGDFDKVNVYGDDPSLIAKKWQNNGAEFIHMVSLNGARGEGNVNDESIKTILDTIHIPIQIGGGIRNKERVKELLDLGVNRVILGSVAIVGWEEVSDVNSITFCRELEKIGVKTIVYTDISKDGMLIGPNFDVYEKLSKETSLDIIASGGVTSMDDVKILKNMNIYGAIIGKALYENKIDLKEVLSLC